RTDRPVSKAEQDSGNIQPTIALYTETAITNWRTVKVGSRSLLSLVVLREQHEVDEGFKLTLETQYRALKLTVEGERRVYTQEIWRKKKTDAGTTRKNAPWEIVDTFTPLQGNGQPWDEIPFQFIGSQNNDA